MDLAALIDILLNTGRGSLPIYTQSLGIKYSLYQGSSEPWLGSKEHAEETFEVPLNLKFQAHTGAHFPSFEIVLSLKPWKSGPE